MTRFFKCGQCNVVTTLIDRGELLHPNECTACHTPGGWERVDNPIDPRHYNNHPSGIECIEVTRHMNFNRGNAVKYIWRCGDKGNPIEDLKKAIWYLNDEIKRLETGSDK